MIFTKEPKYLPYEQPNKGGPFFLSLIGDGMAAGEYDIPAPEGQVYLIFRLTDGAPDSAFDVSYNGLAFTWENRMADGRNIWNGRVGMFLIPNNENENVTIEGAFGVNGTYLEWLAAAEVIGDAIYPSLMIEDADIDFSRQSTSLTSGRVKVTNRSDEEIFAASVKLNAGPLAVGETFRQVRDEGTCVMFPTGIDGYNEEILPVYRRPGWARKIAVMKLVGPRAYGGGLDSGIAVDAALSFKESF